MYRFNYMREIKFRAWDRANNRMVFWTLNDILCRFGENEYREDRKDCSPFFIWMLSTGLKDKNGKKIYRGDIVGKEGVYHFIDRENWEPEKGNWKIIGEKIKDFSGKGNEKYIAGYELTLVRWVDDNCGFEPFSDSLENCGHCGGAMDPKEIEIIGNIYENPELLK